MQQYELLKKIVETHKLLGKILKKYKTGYDELINDGYDEESAQNEMDSELLDFVLDNQVSEYCEDLAKTCEKEYNEFMELMELASEY